MKIQGPQVKPPIASAPPTSPDPLQKPFSRTVKTTGETKYIPSWQKWLDRKGGMLLLPLFKLISAFRPSILRVNSKPFIAAKPPSPEDQMPAGAIMDGFDHPVEEVASGNRSYLKSTEAEKKPELIHPSRQFGALSFITKMANKLILNVIPKLEADSSARSLVTEMRKFCELYDPNYGSADATTSGFVGASERMNEVDQSYSNHESYEKHVEEMLGFMDDTIEQFDELSDRFDSIKTHLREKQVLTGESAFDPILEIGTLQEEADESGGYNAMKKIRDEYKLAFDDMRRNGTEEKTSL